MQSADPHQASWSLLKPKVKKQPTDNVGGGHCIKRTPCLYTTRHAQADTANHRMSWGWNQQSRWSPFVAARSSLHVPGSASCEKKRTLAARGPFFPEGSRETTKTRVFTFKLEGKPLRNSPKNQKCMQIFWIMNQNKIAAIFVDLLVHSFTYTAWMLPTGQEATLIDSRAICSRGVTVP